MYACVCEGNEMAFAFLLIDINNLIESTIDKTYLSDYHDPSILWKLF